MAVEKQAYREAMARLGAAVNVITTDGPGGRAGFTASAVCSVTDSPPTLLVCANRTNDLYPAMKANAVLCVNTLASAHEDLSPVFAGMTEHTMEARFEGATWHTLLTGPRCWTARWSPSTAASSRSSRSAPTTCSSAAVEAVEVGTGHEGLIYYARGYHRVIYEG